MTKLCDTCEYLRYCARSGIEEVGCDRYKKDMTTNEEWLRSCNTEQLANAFFEYRYTYATPRQKLWMSASEECIKKDIVGWLKQPHTPKE